MFIACCVGTGFGILNGLLTKMALSWAINRSDKVFYGIWAGGFLYRLIFLPMIFAQISIQLWPVKGLRKVKECYGLENHT